MPLHYPAVGGATAADIASLSAQDVWAYLPNRRLTNLADVRAGYIDLIPLLGTGGTPVPAGNSLYDVLALQRWDIRLSVARAALIDNLDVLLSTRLSKADFDVRLSAARAALIDNLLSVETSGTISHPNGVGETDALEITPSELTEYPVLLLDTNNLTQNTTIRSYIKVDGATYRLLNSAVFPTDFPTNAKGVPIVLYPTSVPWKITLQSAIAEGASRDVPYRYVRRSLM